MPELPEIESVARSLDRRAAGRTVAEVRVVSLSALKTYDPPVGALTGLDVTACERRGKFLLLEVAPLWLIVHFGRAGWLRWYDRIVLGNPSPRGTIAARIRFTDGGGIDITEQGRQKRLAIYVVTAPENVPGIGRLGVDVLARDFDRDRLAAILEAHPRQLKALLVDQSIIAGLGNAYSDEVLHAARLSPFKQSRALSEGQMAGLHDAINTTVRSAVARASQVEMAALKPDKRAHMAVHGRAGLPCPTCGDTVASIHLATRSFEYCPACQTGGRVLRDRRLSRLLVGPHRR